MPARRFSVLLVPVYFVLIIQQSLAQDVYWVDANLNAIKKVSVNGGSPQTILQNDDFDTLALDLIHQKLYYTTGSSGCTLYRSNLDGTGSLQLATFDSQNFIRGMSIDPAAGKIYWTSNDSMNASSNASGKVRRANLDGTNVQDLVTGMNYPDGATLDINAGKIYWLRQETDSIERANLNGSSVQDLVALGPSSYAFSIAFSGSNNRIYWTDPGNSLVGRANSDGSNVQTHSPLPQGSLDSGIAIDPTADRIFWGDTSTHAIYTSDLNGGNAHIFLSSGVNYPSSLAVTPEPASGALVAMLLTLTLGFRRFSCFSRAVAGSTSRVSRRFARRC